MAKSQPGPSTLLRVAESESELVDFPCPRCSRLVSERFYGPCLSCCGELRSTMASEARVIDVVAFEPKMHVVPNQVATKD